MSDQNPGALLVSSPIRHDVRRRPKRWGWLFEPAWGSHDSPLKLRPARRAGPTSGGLFRRTLKNFAAFALVACASFSSFSRADVTFPIPTELGSGITIKISSPATSVPHFGFLPLRVSIENLTTHEGTWRFRFDAGMPRSFPGVATSTFELAVPATQTRDAWFYVPMAGPGVSLMNTAALTAGSAATGAQLPTAPPPIPGVYPNPGLPGVTFDERRNISAGPSGLMRIFTITQTGPASALPPIPSNRLPPRATTSIATNTNGTVTRTTTIPVAVNPGNTFGGPAINPSSVAMNNARQELTKVGMSGSSARVSMSVQVKAGAKAGTQEVTVSIKQTGSAESLPLPPTSTLPPGFTAVNVAPEPGSPGNVTREFTYVETVSTLAPSIAASAAFPPPRSLSLADAQTEARKILAPTKLLDPAAGVKTTPSMQYLTMSSALGSGSMSSPYSMILFEQVGPSSLLPMPPINSLPAGVRVTVLPGVGGGTVTRMVSVVDPALVNAMYSAAASATGAGTVAAQSTHVARMELLRLGFLRSQAGVTVAPPVTRSSGAPGAPSPDLIVFTETGPGNLLPGPSTNILPTGITCNVTPGALSGEVARNFVVNIPGFLAGGGTISSAPTRSGGGAPMRISGMASTPNVLSIDVAGPGLPRNGRASFPNAVNATSMGPLATTPAIEQVVRGKFSSSGSRALPYVAGFEPTQVPADWRVWSSFNSALLPADEFAALDGARRAALRTWVATGGVLFLSPEVAGEPRTERVGAGRIETLSEPIADVQPTDIFTRLQLGSFSPGMPDRDRTSFGVDTPIGQLVKFEPADTLWISLFLVVFAALIGPVNLLWLAPPARRYRLFFTTPLISLAGAAAVAGAIVLQDGIGGDGIRRALVWFVPGENQAAIFQEQGARCGFLTDRSFGLDDSVLCAVLPVDGNIHTSIAGNRVFTRERGRAAGDWFGNRARQAHLLRTLAPTRARIEVVAAAADGTPTVESTLTTELRDFRLRDADGRTWRASSVPTGRRVALQPEIDLGAPPKNPAENGTPNLAGLLKEATTLTEPWQWVASGGGSDLAPIVTLRAVRWVDDPVVYAGFAERAGSPRRPAIPTDATKSKASGQ
jgi:hypothetical protein